MDVHVFKSRLKQLAFEVAPAAAAPQISLSGKEIMGRLWCAELARKAQRFGICVAGLQALLWYKPVYADTTALVSAVVVMAFVLVTVGLSSLVPYWAFRRGVHEGLLSLADLPLNDPARFVSAQKTDLTVLCPRLMSDLCRGLYTDARLSN